MALPLVLMFIVVIFGILIYITAIHRHDMKRQIILRENFRAFFLAKGAIQLALLKVKFLPQEFRDACIFFEGLGTIENMVNPPQDKSYLGLRDPDTGAWINEGEFIRELKLTMSQGATPGFDSDNGLICDGPFDGNFVITELRLLTNRIGRRGDSVKIIARAREISGKTLGTKPLNEGEKLEEIHELMLK